MSFKEKLKEARENAAKERRENEAFKKIVRERTRAEERRAFEKEALKVASERGAAKARPVSFVSRVVGTAGEVRRLKQAVAPRRAAPVRRTVRRTTRRYATPRRYTTRRVVRRAVRRYAAPRRNVRRAAPVQRASQQPAAFDIGSFV